ncbi:hypothetical protein [Haloglomus halophilum]|jgi:hypothetical protein|uniref:hypothetical protein n=1 Tax=Haloglomus halophilum TaxID=2962672 RepID=UPI0020C96377|nr:hypothetical protein [Haloglomus halophilum]
MDPVTTATSLLTATTLVFAGSSFLIGELEERVEQSIEESDDHSEAIYLATAAGFGFTILTALFCVAAIVGNFSFGFDLLPVDRNGLVKLASYSLLGAITAPSCAAVIASWTLFNVHR